MKTSVCPDSYDRFTRRGFLKGALGLAATLAIPTAAAAREVPLTPLQEAALAGFRAGRRLRFRLGLTTEDSRRACVKALVAHHGPRISYRRGDYSAAYLGRFTSGEHRILLPAGKEHFERRFRQVAAAGRALYRAGSDENDCVFGFAFAYGFLNREVTEAKLREAVGC